MKPVARPAKPARVLSSVQRIDAIEEVYGAVLNATGTFYGRAGGDLAYLLGAIAKGTSCQFRPGSAIVRALRVLGQDHVVWDHITIERDE